MFKSKTEIAGSNYECEDISDRLYLWTPVNHKPSRLIITAHGIRRTTSSFQIKQDVTLRFYSEDKNSVQDPGLRKFYEGKAKPAETLRKGANCYNYILTKYTNSQRNTGHNKNNESYQSINKIMTTDYAARGLTTLKTISDLHHDGKIGPNAYEMSRSMALKDVKLNRAAILTIRNRRMKADVNLQWVLAELFKKGHKFTTIDCLFCRNTLFTAVVGSMRVGGDYSDAVAFS